MTKSLWVKFLVLLLSVSMIALSAALLIREMMLRDFHAYLEGDQEDHVYSITADLEGSYEQNGYWRKDAIQRNAVWAFLLGLETRLSDVHEVVIMDTDRALSSLSPLMKQRVEELSAPRRSGEPSQFIPYPLFLGGQEIGKLDVRFLQPKRESIFIARTNLYLLSALGIVGGLALLLSIVFSNRLTRPLRELDTAAAAISDGDLSKRVLAASTDELGRLARTFNRMAVSLQIQENLRKKLISNVAHELRTPLTAIQGEIEGMIDGLIPVDKDQLQSLRDETVRLAHILDGLDELSQAQASTLTLKKRKFALKPFLAIIVERFSKSAQQSGIRIDLECPENLMANADPDRLSQIVINLMSNAMKAVAKDGVVTIVAEREGFGISLLIKDTGSGIKKEDLPLIFERFYRGSSGGLGLGLAIVRELVDAHEGTIDVKSEVGSGSIFTVHLPE